MEEWFELMTLEASRQELKRVLECNQETSKYGLSLTEEEARELMAEGDAKGEQESRIRSRNTPGTDQGVLRFPVHPERGVCGHSGKASGDILSV